MKHKIKKTKDAALNKPIWTLYLWFMIKNTMSWRQC